MCTSPATPSRRGSTPRPRTGASCRSRAGSSTGARHRGPASASIMASTPARPSAPSTIRCWPRSSPTGPRARRRRRGSMQALEETTALGIATNRGFLIDCLRHEEFAAGDATTQFIPSTSPSPPHLPPTRPRSRLPRRCGSRRAHAGTGHDPARAWSSSGPLSWPLRLEVGGRSAARTVTVSGRAATGSTAARPRARCELALRRRRDGAASPGRGGAERALLLRRRQLCISRSAPRPRRARDALRAARVRQRPPAARTRSCARP